MSWKIVFNTDLHHYGHIAAACKKAKECGYQYFCFNGRVYEVDGKDTGLTDKDLY